MEKERRTKALVIVVLLIVVAGLTVAFAALSTTLNINGTAYLDAAKWGIRFENLSSPTKIGSANVTGTAKIEETKSAEITGINVGLSTPGDKVTYTADLVNKGTINAKIDNIEKTVLTQEQQKYLTFKVTDKSGNEVSKGDILSAGETRNLTITIEFIKDLTKEDLPTNASTISLSYKLNFVQTDEKVTSAGQGSDTDKNYAVGDEFCLDTECFYTMKDNGDTITALAKYNLLVGNDVVMNSNFAGVSSSTPIPTSEEGYGLQNENAVNYKFDDSGLPTTTKVKGAIIFAPSTDAASGYWADDTLNHNLLSKYGTGYPADVFDSNSTLYEPLQNYNNYLKNTLGKSSVTTRLITYSDLTNLGCKNDTCTGAPSWVYSVNYWTGTANDYHLVYFVFSNAGVGGHEKDQNGLFGLRPVITIKKSEL